MGIGYSAVSPKKVSIGKGIAIVAIAWAALHPRQSRLGRGVLLIAIARLIQFAGWAFASKF